MASYQQEHPGDPGAHGFHMHELEIARSQMVEDLDSAPLSHHLQRRRRPLLVGLMLLGLLALVVIVGMTGDSGPNDPHHRHYRRGRRGDEVGIEPQNAMSVGGQQPEQPQQGDYSRYYRDQYSSSRGRHRDTDDRSHEGEEDDRQSDKHHIRHHEKHHKGHHESDKHGERSSRHHGQDWEREHRHRHMDDEGRSEEKLHKDINKQFQEDVEKENARRRDWHIKQHQEFLDEFFPSLILSRVDKEAYDEQTSSSHHHDDDHHHHRDKKSHHDHHGGHHENEDHHHRDKKGHHEEDHHGDHHEEHHKDGHRGDHHHHRDKGRHEDDNHHHREKKGHHEEDDHHHREKKGRHGNESKDKDRQDKEGHDEDQKEGENGDKHGEGHGVGHIHGKVSVNVGRPTYIQPPQQGEQATGQQAPAQPGGGDVGWQRFVQQYAHTDYPPPVMAARAHEHDKRGEHDDDDDDDDGDDGHSAHRRHKLLTEEDVELQRYRTSRRLRSAWRKYRDLGLDLLHKHREILGDVTEYAKEDSANLLDFIRDRIDETAARLDEQADPEHHHLELDAEKEHLRRQEIDDERERLREYRERTELDSPHKRHRHRIHDDDDDEHRHHRRSLDEEDDEDLEEDLDTAYKRLGEEYHRKWSRLQRIKAAKEGRREPSHKDEVTHAAQQEDKKAAGATAAAGKEAESKKSERKESEGKQTEGKKAEHEKAEREKDSEEDKKDSKRK